MNKKIILYIIFYLILTSFFIYIFIKEKYINKNIAVKIEKLSEKISEILGIKSEGKKNILLKTLKIIESFGTAIILVLIIQRFYLGNFMVPTGSMKPTIVPKDRLFGNMVSYKFRDLSLDWIKSFYSFNLFSKSTMEKFVPMAFIPSYYVLCRNIVISSISSESYDSSKAKSLFIFLTGFSRGLFDIPFPV